MSTAGTPLNASSPMYIGWNTPDTSSEYYVYMHFTEIQKLKANETRSFNITLNDKPFYGPLVPDNLSTITVYSPAALTGGNFTFSLFKTESSTLPPILNAMEYYRVIDFSQSETNGDDGTHSLFQLLLLIILVFCLWMINLTITNECLWKEQWLQSQT